MTRGEVCLESSYIFCERGELAPPVRGRVGVGRRGRAGDGSFEDESLQVQEDADDCFYH